MADERDTLTAAGVWRQAVAAVVVVAVLSVGAWTFGNMSSSDSEPSPATCSGGEAEKTPGQPGKASGGTEKAPRPVSGAQLCEALNRSDLAELLGTPDEMAKTAGGSGGSLKLGGKEIATPSARIEFGTYTVTLSATYDRLPVDGSAALLGYGAQQQTVLGRPAVLYPDRTTKITFRFDGGDSDVRPGVPAQALTVAQDAKDSGGSFDVTLWRTDGRVPDDAVLLRVAEEVLPTVPGWAAGG